MRSLPDEHIRWTFDLHRKSCSGNVDQVPFPIDKSSYDICSVRGMLPCHNLDLTKTLEELVHWLSTSEECTSLLMAVEAVATWRQYHIREIKELTPDVLARLYKRLKYLAIKRRWSLLSPRLQSYKFWFGVYNRYNRYSDKHEFHSVNVLDLTSLISPCKDYNDPYVMIDCVEEYSNPFAMLIRRSESKLLFHFKHPATPTCTLLSNCGFILKTVPSESALWRVKLCTEEEDYRNEMVHFHEEVRLEKIHLCLTALYNKYNYGKNPSYFHLVPLTWLGWIFSEEELQKWSDDYSLVHHYDRKFFVLYNTTT